MNQTLYKTKIGYNSKPLFRPYLGLWLVLFMLLCSACFTIERAPRRWSDDGSAKYDQTLNTVLYQSEQITILNTSVEELSRVANNSEGYIYVWAPWCAPCLNSLKYKFDQTFQEVDNLMLVSTNYDLPNIVKILEGKVDTAYVLSSSEFGATESAKLKGLSQTFVNRSLEYLPQYYFYSNGVFELAKL